MDLRCTGRLHGRIDAEGMLEVKCPRRSCGHAAGVVVLHTFDLRTGKYITRVFADPVKKADTT